MNERNGLVKSNGAGMALAIKRLKRSKAEAHGEDQSRGITEGQRWAAEHATCRELQALMDIAEPFWQRNGKRADEDAGHDLVWALAMRLHLRFGEVHTPAEMKSILFPGPERRRSPAHVAGFVVGAGGVWHELMKGK